MECLPIGTRRVRQVCHLEDPDARTAEFWREDGLQANQPQGDPSELLLMHMLLSEAMPSCLCHDQEQLAQWTKMPCSMHASSQVPYTGPVLQAELMVAGPHLKQLMTAMPAGRVVHPV